MALANCLRCEKLFEDRFSRGHCGDCWGQLLFKKPPSNSPAEVGPAGGKVSLRSLPVHSLRCETYAQKGRAHQPAIRRGVACYW